MSTDVPLYKSERVEFWLADARQVLGKFETERFGVVVTDPPYGVNFTSGFRSEAFGVIHNDGQEDRAVVNDILVQCVRLVGQARHLYVFGPSDVMDGLKVSETTSLVWDKGTNGAGNLSSPWAPAHEPITFAVSRHRHAGQTGARSLPVRLRKGSVLRFSRKTGRNVRHPNEKPVGLLREMIESSTRLGETVLDPFAGSGSTAVAAVLSGRKAVIVESDARWVDLILDRIKNAEKAADCVEAASR